MSTCNVCPHLGYLGLSGCYRAPSTGLAASAMDLPSVLPSTISLDPHWDIRGWQFCWQYSFVWPGTRAGLSSLVISAKPTNSRFNFSSQASWAKRLEDWMGLKCGLTWVGRVANTYQ